MSRTIAAVLVAAIALVLLGVAPANAATARINDGAGDVPYSFAAQADVTAVLVLWTNRLSVQITYTAPPPPHRLRLLVSAAARDEIDTSVQECDPDAADTLTVTGDQQSATFADPAIDGTLTVPATWHNSTVTYVFDAPTLGRKYNVDGSDPFVCLDGTAGEDTFFGTFAGRAAQLSGDIADQAMRRELDRRYSVGDHPDTLVRCLARGAREPVPADDTFDGLPALRWCAFEAPLSGASRVAFGSGAVWLDRGRAKVRFFHAQRLPRGSRDCGTTDFSGKWLLAPFPENFGGAYLSVWARRVTCSTARRVARRRLRGQGTFACTTLKTGHEYLRMRCAARGGRTIWLETGA